MDSWLFVACSDVIGSLICHRQLIVGKRERGGRGGEGERSLSISWFVIGKRFFGLGKKNACHWQLIWLIMY